MTSKMAEAPLPFGHDEVFTREVEDDFQCLICHLTLKQPVQTRCGHRFCKECLEEHHRQEVQSRNYTCPADREGLDRDRDVFPDKATERKILSFAIKCPSEDCNWTGELRNKEVHLATCPFKVVSCTNKNCHMTLKRNELEQHVMITCEWRIVDCEYCAEPHPECHMQVHLATCPFKVVSCTNKNCHMTLKRNELEQHVMIVDCEYCGEPHSECHMQQAVSEHGKITSLSDEGNETKARALPGEVLACLLSTPCDSKQVVQLLKESLHLDEVSLKYPDPMTKLMIRCLARKAKCLHRLDVVKHLREITRAGTTGPLLPESLDVGSIPISQGRELAIALSGGNEWMLVAEKLGLPLREIRFLNEHTGTLNPANAALKYIAPTVGKLYEALCKCELPVMADKL